METYIYNNPQLKDLRRTLRKNQTPAEKLIWSKLRNKYMSGFKFFRQYSVGRYILDFYCPQAKLAIEIDGGHHGKSENQQLDIDRTNYLKNSNIKVIRFWNSEVLGNLDGVLKKIEGEILKLTPSSSLLNKREGKI